MKVRFLDWGYVDYKRAWSMQEHLLEKKLEGRVKQDMVIFTEHESIYTLGRRGKKENILRDRDTFEREGIEILEVNRGGDITYHGPGQLMVYFIFSLNSFDNDPHLMMRWIEGLVMDTLQNFSLEGYRIQGKTGVFCNGKKIASIGLGFRKWVSFHGLALNVDPGLKFFSYIRPCGLDIEMTSLAKELRRTVKIEDAKNKIKEIVNRRYGYDEIRFDYIREDKKSSAVSLC